ncbi:MAG: dephospho-CoA kinase [Bdellovibrionales bacterium]|nr:dephospho-CoA kinase [Bdellovibrionales bacterium]
MYNIIITGSLGSGKSSVASILKHKSYSVFSADIIINNIYEDGIFKKEMANIFSLTEKQVSKKSISDIAFKDQAKLKKLEKLLYPELNKRVKQHKELCKQKKSLYFFYEAPVFFEKKETTDYDCVLVVSANKEHCESRLLKKNMSKQKFDKIYNMQIPIQKKEELADYVIFNNSNLLDLKDKTKLFLKFLKQKYE